MRNIVNPYFEEDFYKGQDTVHYGAMMPLHITEDEAKAGISRNAQRIIKEGYTNFSFSTLMDLHLPYLRDMWFDPKDPSFPDKLEYDIFGWAAYEPSTQELLGGVIWKVEGKNLFLYHLIASEKGKKMQIPTLLIWHSWLNLSSMANLSMNSWSNLDIGVSYNPNRWRFFQNFAIKKYPVILKPPFYAPVIRLSPFRSLREPDEEKNISMPVNNWTFVPRASYGIYAILRHLDLQPEDHVTIIKSFPTEFISGCVTKNIEKVCKWKLWKEGDRIGKVVLLIHEFGIPAKITEQFVNQLRSAGIIVIEDCAWRATKVFEQSDYAVYSAQKMLNTNFGAFIQGVDMPEKFLWDIGVLDFVKQQKAQFFIGDLEMIGAERRIRNWVAYAEMVRNAGMQFDTMADYGFLITQKEWIPTVYMQRFADDQEALAVKARLEEFGIQAGIYWGQGALYLPIHQCMTLPEVEYMFAVVAGYFNTCRNYNGK